MVICFSCLPKISFYIIQGRHTLLPFCTYWQRKYVRRRFYIFEGFFFKYKKINISYQIFELLISKYFLISKNNFYFLKNSIFRYQKFEIIDIRTCFFHSRKSIFDIKSWPSFNDIKISSFFIIKKIIFWYKELHDIKKYLGILDVKNHFIFRYQKIYFVDKPKKKLTVNFMTVPCDATFIFLPGICCGSVILQFMMVAYDNIL